MKNKKENREYFRLQAFFKPTDIYWHCETVEGELDTALCHNQNGFRGFINDIIKYSRNEWLKDDIQNKDCWSESRYPLKYPCLVQIWRHFEGGMVYIGCEYNKTRIKKLTKGKS